MNNSYLMHHGIKGQKWGVRRFQNPDGTLTDAGKNRYYTKDEYGRDVLNENGKKYNKKQGEKVKSYKNATLYNLQKVSPEWNRAKTNYLNAAKENNLHYLKEREKWFKQEGEYKGKDYYEFKDISADKWYGTDGAKAESKAVAELTRLATKAAKEHPLFSKTYEKLSDVSTASIFGDPIKIETKNYGEEVVKQILMDVRIEAINNQKSKLGD